MLPSRRSPGPFVLLALLAGAPVAQQPARAPGPPQDAGTRPAGDGVVAEVPGRILDLAVQADGLLLYCTEEGEVGRIDPRQAGTTAVLAPAGTFGEELRAVTETPAGDVAVLDEIGDIHVLVGGSLPAELLYDDRWMVLDPTDLIADAGGNFLIASSTPASGQRGVNWISSEGTRWAYYFVKHGPVQIAADPLTAGILVSDENDGGVLRLVAPFDPTRPISLLEGTTQVGLAAEVDDGDVAFEADGDLFWIAGERVWFHDRTSGQTTLFARQRRTLRGVAITDRTGDLESSTPYSLYVVEGEHPSLVRELPGVGEPADPLAIDQGFVPGRGINLNVTPGMQVFCLAADSAGDLILGGGLFSTTYHLNRILLPERTRVEIADDTDGLAGIVEGVVVAPDDTLYVITREGVLQAITENPFSITTLFDDPLGQVNAAKGLAMAVDGRFYVSERASYGFGGVTEIDVVAGTATRIVPLAESHGLAPRPGGGLYANEWNNTGFVGTVGEVDLGTNQYTVLPGFDGINYANGPVWGDGDLLVDALGRVYSVSEDDWSLVRHTPGQTGFQRIGSGYVNHVSGMVIAPSTPESGSTTGWSLYVSEYDFVWEKPDAPGPGPSLVDNSASLRWRGPRRAAPKRR